MNGILLVDKPQGWTSHDVVAKLRGVLGERRIGHSGTLDPMATGLLVVFLGRATRAVQFAEAHEKTYLAGMRTGIVTDTQDITGEVLKTSGIRPKREDLLSVLPEFTGELMQLPPMYSAVKINGQRLYKLARNGVEIQRQPRPITIGELSLLGEGEGDFSLRIRCSKGTYIRTLVNDIGEKMGCGAALSSLRRITSGDFSISQAYTLEQIIQAAEESRAEGLLLPVDSLFSLYPPLSVNDEQLKKCLCGSSIPIAEPDGEYRFYAPDGSFLLLGSVCGGVMTTVKSFFEV